MLLVGLLLLLTCANIAGLFLVRAGRRAHEVTIRAALGATAARIARRCLAESLLLAVAGGAAGCLAGSWVKTTLAVQVMGTSRQFAAGFALDWRILGFAAGITLTTAAVFGLAPTVHAFRLGRRVPSALNQRSGDGMSGLRGLRPIVVLQLALSVVVVFSATLLGRTLINLSRLDPGFDQEHVIGAYFNLAAAGYSSAEAPAVRERLLAAATSVPGVASSAIATCGLLSTQTVSQRAFLRNFARGEAYLQEAPTLWDVTFQTAVAQAELEARRVRRRTTTGWPSTAPTSADVRCSSRPPVPS